MIFGYYKGADELIGVLKNKWVGTLKGERQAYSGVGKSPKFPFAMGDSLNPSNPPPGESPVKTVTSNQIVASTFLCILETLYL